jgi:CDP-glucose 4,6-dehydratase
LRLAERLFTDGADFAEAWNFGPLDEDARSVRWIIEQLAIHRPELSWQCEPAPQVHEAHYLKLDSSKAGQRLSWQPRWRLATALQKTLAWHDAWRDNQNMQTITLAQIDDYTHGTI